MTTPGYILETVIDTEAVEVLPQMEGQPIEVLIPPGSKVLEVYTTPPETHFKIGGVNPVNDPTILVWFDTQGAQA